jgi:hypothetical protein
LVLLFISPAFAQLTTTKLLPNSYVTTHGSDNGTPVSALDVLDESGLVSNSTEFVQFKAKSAGATYTGYRTYNLPKSIHAGSISQIRLLVNYRGPMSSTQAWTWSLFDWVNAGYFAVGNNFFAPPFSPWTILNFNLNGNNLANYVRGSDGQIRVQVVSNNTSGDADVDYEALLVTTTSTPTAPSKSFYVSTAAPASRLNAISCTTTISASNWPASMLAMLPAR